MEDFYVKNTTANSKVFLKLKPILSAENNFSYEGTEIIAAEGKWETETYPLTYRDLLRMYEAGYHTIERDEYERAEALMKLKNNKEIKL